MKGTDSLQLAMALPYCCKMTRLFPPVVAVLSFKWLWLCDRLAPMPLFIAQAYTVSHECHQAAVATASMQACP